MAQCALVEDVIDYRELGRLVEAGIERSVAGKTVAGFALVTDDEVCSLSAVLAPAGEPRFDPVEWPTWLHDEDLDAASELLARRAELDGQDGYHTQSDRAFACLVDALVAARTRGLFAEDAYLSVLSSDPHPEMEAKEHAAVLRLNSPSTIRAWRQWRLAEARRALAWMAEVGEKTYAMMDTEAQLRGEIEQLTRELER